MGRKFSDEYKTDAVRMVLENGISVSQVAKELGIGNSTMGKWLGLYRSKGGGQNDQNKDQEELRKLRVENEKLRLEKELLKKAAVFFATERSS